MATCRLFRHMPAWLRLIAGLRVLGWFAVAFCRPDRCALHGRPSTVVNAHRSRGSPWPRCHKGSPQSHALEKSVLLSTERGGDQLYRLLRPETTCLRIMMGSVRRRHNRLRYVLRRQCACLFGAHLDFCRHGRLERPTIGAAPTQMTLQGFPFLACPAIGVAPGIACVRRRRSAPRSVPPNEGPPLCAGLITQKRGRINKT